MIYESRVLAAEGYLDLGMARDAWSELNLIEDDDQFHVDVIKMRIDILMYQHKWKDAYRLASQLCKILPSFSEFYIDTAECLFRMREKQRAVHFLEKAPANVRLLPEYFYNLACYETSMGQFTEAEANLLKSFKMNRAFKNRALSDPDLKRLRKSVKPLKIHKILKASSKTHRLPVFN
ncbi:MAG: hypothetical protein SGI71_07455 [Verrucomicrobiota bacterium]|nr:hypothetical protein [Verrucomicrobiota bacterium]